MAKRSWSYGENALLKVDPPTTASPSPRKKRRTICLALKSQKQRFSLDKLKYSRTLTEASANDDLFNRPQTANNYAHIQWILACKFIIASNYCFDHYDVLGMNRSKIPKNFSFFVDEQENICAVIRNCENCKISTDIVQHCNKIETCLIQRYIFNIGETIDIDQYLKNIANTMVQKQTKLSFEFNTIDNRTDICVIRIAMVYYVRNLRHSFYEHCCKITKHLSIKQQFAHPLFLLFYKTIANFDCFQCSVPMTPLSGSLYRMFCQFSLGINEWNPSQSNHANARLTYREFRAFLGCFDCWMMAELRRSQRSAVEKAWKYLDVGFNVVPLVIEYADMHKMSDQKMLEFIAEFNENSPRWKVYCDELKQHNLFVHDIVDYSNGLRSI
jgi:hypothetical protein